MKMDAYYAGLDGGGTKTSVCVLDSRGNEVLHFVSGSISFTGQTAPQAAETLRSILVRLGEECGLPRIARLCVAAAGVSGPDVVPHIKKTVQSCGFAGVLSVTGDQVAALAGALEKASGVILLAGTGSICYGRGPDGQECRSGGWGHLIGDEGSGYAIGREILAAVVRAEDGRDPPTALTELVYRQIGITSVADLIRYVYTPSRPKRDMAALAPLLDEGCHTGDSACLEIARQAGTQLAALALPVVNRLHQEQGELALAGSVLLNSTFVREETVRTLRHSLPGITCVAPRRDAAYGAALLALLGEQL